ncbi:hibernation-specific plasma protein HP-55-like [Antennarius striatus]|uniref:hibernation-specific plasma protein HP-55-like n=1 Tax=Antennarius striatus TaxID=241820 RepID=UPI0035AD912A
MNAALSLWILSALVCAGRSHQHAGGDPAKVDGGSGLDGSATSVSLVTEANREFAFRLYRKLAAHADSQGKNVFFSPASVSVALAALSVGARGETHRQLVGGLGFNDTRLTQTDIDQAFKTLLEKTRETSNEAVSEGTAVFVDNRFSPRPEFLENLMQSYLADGFKVDFTQTTQSADRINKYVEEKTKGKIAELVNDIDPSTVMYLISYIYFKGKWATPFDPQLTKEDTFTVDENTKVPVQMMKLEETFDTYEDKSINTSVLHLPFNSSYSMLLLLPKDMAPLENAICPNHVNKWLRWMKPRKYEVHVPKFSIKTSYSLVDVLTQMGMTDMFGSGADLTGISEGQLKVSEVVHKATLDVDEAGATATAATGIGITLYSMHHVPVLRFDRPFMAVITERNTGNILFLGKIVNPTLEE